MSFTERSIKCDYCEYQEPWKGNFPFHWGISMIELPGTFDERKVGWTHLCPECVEKHGLKNDSKSS